MDQILWCDHSNVTSSAVLSHGTIYLVCSSNFWDCGWNPKVFSTIQIKPLWHKVYRVLFISYDFTKKRLGTFVKCFDLSLLGMKGLIKELSHCLYVKSWSWNILIEKWKHVTWIPWFIRIIDIFLFLPSPPEMGVHFELKMNVLLSEGQSTTVISRSHASILELIKY